MRSVTGASLVFIHFLTVVAGARAAFVTQQVAAKAVTKMAIVFVNPMSLERVVTDVNLGIMTCKLADQKDVCNVSVMVTRPIATAPLITA